MQIEVRRYVEHGPNGDRDRVGVDYFSYKVVLINDDGEEVVLRDESGYDHFHTAPLAMKPLADKIGAYATDVANVLDASVETRTFRATVVTSKEWVEDHAG